MTSRIPIYQMTYGKDEDGNVGLQFGSEQGDTGSQSVVFVAPIPDTLHAFEIIKSLQHIEIYFPFEMDAKYYELKAKIDFPRLIFEIPNLNSSITFVIDSDGISSRVLYPFVGKKNRIKYIGRMSNLIPSNIGFMILIPVELQKMNELYEHHKAVFVGRTPNFGNADSTLP